MLAEVGAPPHCLLCQTEQMSQPAENQTCNVCIGKHKKIASNNLPCFCWAQSIAAIKIVQALVQHFLQYEAYMKQDAQTKLTFQLEEDLGKIYAKAVIELKYLVEVQPVLAADSKQG